MSSSKLDYRLVVINILSLVFMLQWFLFSTLSHSSTSLIFFYPYFNDSIGCAKWVCFSFRSQYKPLWNQGLQVLNLKKWKEGRKEGRVKGSKDRLLCLFHLLLSWSLSPWRFVQWMFKLRPLKADCEFCCGYFPGRFIGKSPSRSHPQGFPFPPAQDSLFFSQGLLHQLFCLSSLITLT